MNNLMSPPLDRSSRTSAAESVRSPLRTRSLAPWWQAPLWLFYPVYLAFILALRRLPDRAALCLGRIFYARIACLAQRTRMQNFR